LPDCALLRASSAFGVNSISLICHPGPDIFQECILEPWFRLATTGPFGQLIAQLLKTWASLPQQGPLVQLLTGMKFPYHRGDVGQGAATEVLPYLLVGRVRGPGGDQGGSGVFNAADGVRG